MIKKSEIQSVLINEGEQGATNFCNEKLKEQLRNVVIVIALMALIVIGTLIYK